MEWTLLIIPLIGVILSYFLYKNQLVIWEVLLPFLATIIIILIVRLSSTAIQVSDKEYWGSIITSAKYYEYWSTWVDQTCTEQYACGTDSKGNTTYCTRTYDCSYCDKNNAYWEAYDDAGNSWIISKEYYNYLKDKWNSVPQFIELNRDIDTHWSCGVDGNAYLIKWDGKIISSESAVTNHSYVNRVQASHSAFKLPTISNKQAKKLGLFKYPEFYSYYKQKVILGIDSIYTKDQSENIETNYQYFNGYYGKINKIKLFVLIFYDKSDQISFDQEAYWDGGNQNELIVTLSLDKITKKIQWVRPFSWTDHKRIIVDIRNDVAAMDIFNPYKTVAIIVKAIDKNDVHKSFEKDFSYLTVDLPTISYIIIIILSIASTILILYWSINNEYTQN